ncbi:hypothetical protein Tco_0424726 [Tanacetum coccineum]
MYTCASNSKLVEPLPEPERTLNQRLRQKNRGVPFEQRNNLPQHLRIVYPPIPNINYFRHLVELLNHDIMDDQPMWAADRVVAPALGSAITLPATANEFDIKELQSQSKQSTPDENDDDIPMYREEEAKFMQTFSQQSRNAFIKETFMNLNAQLKTVAKNHQASIQNLETKFDRLTKKKSGRPYGSLPSNTQPNPRGNNSKAYQPPQSRNEQVNVIFTRSGKTYDLPINPNDQQEDAKIFDSDDENEEPTPQPKP